MPRGTVENVLRTLKQQQDMDSAFGYTRLREMLKGEDHLSHWKDAVEESFDDTWQTAVEQAEAEGSTSKSN